MFLLTVKCVDGSMQIVGWHEDVTTLTNYARETLQAKQYNIDLIKHVGKDGIMVEPTMVLKNNEELKGDYLKNAYYKVLADSKRDVTNVKT